MKNICFLTICLFGMLGIYVSCTNERINLDDVGKVQFTVDDFIPEENLTKTTCDPSNGFKITWASGDVIGIFPREGFQEPFAIPADQVGKAYANFDGGYWNIKNGLQYGAYYPFDVNNFQSADEKTRIHVSYTNQQQSGTTCGLGAYDYTYSDWQTATDGSASFQFHHIGAFVEFSLILPATATYTRLEAKVSGNLIPHDGTYDLTADQVAFVADDSSKTSSMLLTMKDGYSGTAGETMKFYMMFPPVDLSAKTINLKLITSDSTYCTYNATKKKNFRAGYYYRIGGDPLSSNIEGTISNWVTPLTFTSSGTGSIKLAKCGTPDNVVVLDYQKNDGNWQEYTVDTYIPLEDGDIVRFRAGSAGNATFNPSNVSYHYFKYSGTGTIAASGNVMSLLDQTLSSSTLNQYCFNHLFYNCTGLTTAPKLTATTLAEGCYQSMFNGCTNLTEAPELPATTLASCCYIHMFEGCTSLSVAPELPATKLYSLCYNSMFYESGIQTAPELPATTAAIRCYERMFYGCKSLTTAPKSIPLINLEEECCEYMFSGCSALLEAPELPATILKKDCYAHMFSGCSSIQATPNLPATTLAQGCYNWMFSSCESIISASSLPATKLETYCYQCMFRGCALKNAPDLPATTLAYGCYTGMFTGCPLVNAPALPATSLAKYCYYAMFQCCTLLQNAPELPAMSLAEDCYGMMFERCTSLTKAPDLPANYLATRCYEYMFNGCSSLNYIKAMFLTTPTTSYTEAWLSDVSSSGTFVKNTSATWDVRGSEGIPYDWTIETASN